ncbi:hypothetical protein [Pseudomonas peli]|uniref:hypothetical protein n=1 Tax=Pseudomonas peli TaxID=592361 RepID=UPI0024AD8A7D|nr:hypothetical protein [Pseudomonas peli]
MRSKAHCPLVLPDFMAHLAAERPRPGLAGAFGDDPGGAVVCDRMLGKPRRSAGLT